MSDVIVQPYVFELEPQEFRAFIYSHENAQNIRWWRASVDPSFNRVTGRAQPQAGNIKWLHEEQNVARFMAIVTDSRKAVKYYPQGVFVTGDLVMMVMPDEIPVGDHDWICPLGRTPGTARLFQSKEPMIRGASVDPGVGTVASANFTVIGTGTAFTTFLRHGDIVEALGQPIRVSSVVSDTRLILDTVPAPSWVNNTFHRRRDLLTYWPAARIQEVRDAGRTYMPATDFLLNGDRTIQWTGDSPLPGATMSIAYTYYPRFEVVPDMTLGSHGVGDLPQPIVVTLRLFKPDALQE